MNITSKGGVFKQLHLLYKKYSAIAKQALPQKQPSSLNYIRHVLQWDVNPRADIIPVMSLQSKMLLPQGVPRNHMYITNVMSGKISTVNAILFDFRYLYEIDTKGNKRMSANQTLLLLDLTPKSVPHFWFSERSWADQGMLKRGWITGILANNLMIQGPEAPPIRHLFEEEAVQYYDHNLHVQLRGNGRWVLIEIKSKNKRTKEQVLDSIAEGKYFLELIERGDIS